VKVILTQDVSKVGAKGDLLDVSDGYGRNFLVRKGLAIEATEGRVKEWEAAQRAREKRELKQEQTAIEVRKKIGGKRVAIVMNAGEEGRLFGSVTSHQIADALCSQYGVEIDKKDVRLDEPIRQTGLYSFKVRLHTGVEAELALEVKAE
jgi:large subunit ribosomal protein L9